MALRTPKAGYKKTGKMPVIARGTSSRIQKEAMRRLQYAIRPASGLSASSQKMATGEKTRGRTRIITVRH